MLFLIRLYVIGFSVKRCNQMRQVFLVFTEKDVNCCVDITSTKDFKYITVNSNTRTSSEVYVMESGNVREGLWPVQKRTNEVQYFLEHHNGFFYILTNAPLKDTETATEGYYLARCKAEKSLMDRWQVVVLPGSDCTFQDMDIFHGHLVLFLRKYGHPLFCSIDMPIDVDFQEPKELGDLDPWFFPIPSNLCSILPGPNNDFMSSTYRLVVSSPVVQHSRFYFLIFCLCEWTFPYIIFYVHVGYLQLSFS